MDRARDWGTRVAHEATLHDSSSFLTLTYGDEALPDDMSVSVREMQLFVKRLRKAISPTRVRYYGCGEYGSEAFRPHYHLIVFGYDFPDKVLWRTSPAGHALYRSPLLESVWTFGHAEIGSVTRESGAYVARYCLKKVSGAPAASHYQRFHPVTGEIVFVRPEFAVMSTRPGLGAGWFALWESDAFPSGFVVLDGKRVPVPRFYKNKLKGRFDNPGSDPGALLVQDDLRPYRLKARELAQETLPERSPERLAVREECATLRQKRFSRDEGL